MTIDSDKALVNAPIQTVYDFLINSENLYQILPQDKISDFTADQTSCSFKVQGGFVISLIQEQLNSNTSIVLKSGEKSPFPFTLTVHLKDMDGSTTEGRMAFEGEVNMFMKMLVEKPLASLFGYMTHRLQKHYAQEI
jgi:carbon monoxide dehydrogenase subunit G